MPFMPQRPWPWVAFARWAATRPHVPAVVSGIVNLLLADLESVVLRRSDAIAV
jgi:hypothetical protein